MDQRPPANNSESHPPQWLKLPGQPADGPITYVNMGLVMRATQHHQRVVLEFVNGDTSDIAGQAWSDAIIQYLEASSR